MELHCRWDVGVVPVTQFSRSGFCRHVHAHFLHEPILPHPLQSMIGRGPMRCKVEAIMEGLLYSLKIVELTTEKQSN
jgi:hypothetical protein